MKIKKGKPRELLKHTNLVGKFSDITVSGTTIGSSNADVTVKAVDDTGKLKSLTTKQQLEVVKGK